MLAVAIATSARLPAYCTSRGKVILAYLPDGALDAALAASDLVQRGPNTLTRRECLLDELARIGASGLAVNNEELAYGLRSIAVAIRTNDGEPVAAVNLAVHGSMVSMDGLIARLGPALRATAEEISRRIGHRSARALRGYGGMTAPTVVVGAGPAGLATAAMLRARGVEAVVLEREDAIAAAWRRHYRSLRLHTVRSLSGLPGARIPRAEGRWVARAALVKYLERYAESRRIEIQTGIGVLRVDRAPDGFELETTTGLLPAAAVVVATGLNAVPFVPPWPGSEAYPGELLHSQDYDDPAPFAGLRVLVAGAGNSGADIALDLAAGGADRVALSARTPPGIVPRQALGLPAQVAAIPLAHLPLRLADAVAGVERRLFVGDLAELGLPKPSDGVFRRHRRRSQLPILDHGFVAAVRDGRIPIVPAVEALGPDGVQVEGGDTLPVDAVIAATGYRPALEGLVGHLGVLGRDGLPRRHGGQVDPEVPGLHFAGFRNPISGALRGIGGDAQDIADALSLPARARTLF
jgi:putative flavoprotein involved in K+ transport